MKQAQTDYWVQEDSAQDTETLDSERWTIVLSSGDRSEENGFGGEITYGNICPRQYCPLVGSRTNFQLTLDHANAFSGENIITVLGKGHRRFMTEKAFFEFPGKIIELPLELGTAQHIYLPVSYLYNQCPKATLLILPADHYAYPQDKFIECTHYMCELAETSEYSIILSGVAPQNGTANYGYIEFNYEMGSMNGDSGEATLFPVTGLTTKAPSDDQEWPENGCLQNTMIAAVKTKTLWDIGVWLQPDMMKRFDTIQKVLSIQNYSTHSNFTNSAIDFLFRLMEPVDFISGILRHITRLAAVVRMTDIEWRDLKQPLEHKQVKTSRR